MASAGHTAGVDRKLTNYGDPEFSKFLRRAFLSSAGLDAEDLKRPVIGIVNTASDYTTCHRDMPQLIDHVKRGVLEAGGLPFVFTVMSLGEILTNPTTMLFRNLMAMELEEQIKSQPMDAVVLLGGCDKTVPAELMAAASADLPAIALVVGPMSVGNYRGERLGACTDCRRKWTDFRGGKLDENEITDVNQELAPSAGTCMVMGTASTMACLTEATGMSVPYAGTAPAVSSQRLRLGVETGRTAVQLAAADRRPSQIMTEGSVRNAVTVLAAISGSTNAVIHLTAIARRLGLKLNLDDFHEIAAQTPLLVDCKPAGRNYLPDMHRDGGVPALLKALEPLLDLDVMTVTGQTLAEVLADKEGPQAWQDTVRTLGDPLGPAGALVTLKGSLAPDGAVLKAAAASEHLLVHEGPAAVFDLLTDVQARLDDESLRLTPGHVLIMRNIGPIGAGMPEAGSIPIPKYLAREGIRDMVRISDGRMSGTAYGTIVLHCAPEAALGGPLALVCDGEERRSGTRRSRPRLSPLKNLVPSTRGHSDIAATSRVRKAAASQTRSRQCVINACAASRDHHRRTNTSLYTSSGWTVCSDSAAPASRKWNLWSYIDARDGAQAVLRALAYDKPGFDNFIIEGVADANATGPVDPGPTASRLARGRLTHDWDEEITRSQTDGQLLEFAICAPQGVLFPGHCGRVSHDIAEAEGRRPRRRRCRVRAPIPAAASPAKSYPGRWDDASSSRCSPIDKCRFCGLSDVR